MDDEPSIGGQFYFTNHAVEKARQRLGLVGTHHQVLARLINAARSARQIRRKGKVQIWRADLVDEAWNFVVIESQRPGYLNQLAVATVYPGKLVCARGFGRV